MQVKAYEGYFESGSFYTSGKQMRIPERKRVILTILDDGDTDKQAAWNDFKRMVKQTEHENALLDSDAFFRDNSSRELLAISDEV